MNWPDRCNAIVGLWLPEVAEVVTWVGPRSDRADGVAYSDGKAAESSTRLTRLGAQRPEECPFGV